MQINPGEYAKAKRQKKMRLIYKKISKYLGFNLISRFYTRVKQKMRRLAKRTIDKIPLIDPHSHFYYFW